MEPCGQGRAIRQGRGGQTERANRASKRIEIDQKTSYLNNLILCEICRIISSYVRFDLNLCEIFSANSLIFPIFGLNLLESQRRAKETQLRAILIDGRIRVGEAGVFTVGDPATSELFAIGGKHYYIDLVEPANDAMGGMSLGTAIAKLSYGLAHLPEMAAALPLQIAASSWLTESRWQIDLDMESEEAPVIFAMTALDAPSVSAMVLAPITAADDPGFVQQLKANPNLPNYVKQSL